jgi:hypothetical protein
MIASRKTDEARAGSPAQVEDIDDEVLLDVVQAIRQASASSIGNTTSPTLPVTARTAHRLYRPPSAEIVPLADQDSSRGPVGDGPS